MSVRSFADQPHPRVCGCRYGTKDLMLPHARASSRRGYSPDDSGGNGPFSGGSIDAGVMPVPSPSHPRARALKLRTQPTADGWTPVDADRVKAARIGDPLCVDLTERACRPLIRLSTHPQQQPRQYASASRCLLPLHFFPGLGVLPVPTPSHPRARASSRIRSAAGGGAPGCGVVVDEGQSEKTRAARVSEPLPSSTRSGPRQGGQSNRRGASRSIGSQLQQLCPRCPGRRPAVCSVVGARRRTHPGSGERRGRPYQCIPHVRGGHGAEPPAF
ncbi:hypothetical protein EVAR_31954_1 [Eumeta japonica]|uniref:Uncharacterized protein n=1 Tax=Eumeta variegata TaxID=151549 RepID=A0A4C1VRB6_EUMVA|nr:hypothetical protein EVAR_31954_1 [Eumeta japonica]